MDGMIALPTRDVVVANALDRPAGEVITFADPRAGSLRTCQLERGERVDGNAADRRDSEGHAI